MKKALKQIVKKIPIAFTKNQQYDKLTNKIIKKVCKPDTNCIDVGAHKGEVLDIILKYSPNGTHYAFEPIPDMYEKLKEKYNSRAGCNIMDIAVSDRKGTSTFNYVVSNPSYSGLIKRKYDRPNETDTTIEVKTDRLDDVLPADYKPGLMKIDVEGGEMLVLLGAKETITRHKPIIIFEHGLGASDFYGSTPDKLFELLHGYGMKISTLKNWLAEKPSLSQREFGELYKHNTEYYFIAHP
ncbi:FkbM family methyltransferase [Polluticoccus soli]|uniref:FkbM family methyltransferase n=1 Tax=Polluticoccus soli TaxID=3034150 RepID=UPI0023E29EA0|nr:FkbM family methyltransferase [Flavipsychrobacter sp. JY13-12]